MIIKYPKSRVLLHWMSAVVILWATISGFWVGLGNPSPAVKSWVGFFNVSLTTLFIPFFAIRLIYALFSKKREDGLLTKREEKMASTGHIALYVVITVVLVTGVLMMERPINFFNYLSIPQPLTDPQLTSLFNKIHFSSCSVLGLLVTGHILAVVKHHWQGKALLRRMSW
ncbi:cytochrome b/b6 domain-containing protein [Erwinia sp. HDF1-3R]|uniref:cytochrome b n=1 Tax=Erwinia sp. HDF1-3R TaxID=3141543 RepID=UPI0031F567D6